MKTTDLIPILLYHLKESDKYGLELIDACSKCSNGEIKVKQPTLYSVLKKLEKSKFISSYWQDSDIGGKRHYFKITANGLSQLETYPPLEELVKMAISDNQNVDIRDEVNDDEEIKNTVSPSPFDNFSLIKPVVAEKKEENVFNKLFVSKDEHIEEILEPNVENRTEKNTEILDEKVVPAEVHEATNISNNTANESILNEIESEEIVSNIKSEEVGDELEKGANIGAGSSLSPICEEKTTEAPAPSFSVFDALDYGNSEEKTDEDITTSPATESFELENPFFKDTKAKSLEEKTNLEINEENSKLLTKDAKSDMFMNNSKVSTFTQKNIKPADTSRDIASLFNEDVKNMTTPTRYETKEDIKYQDYVDIKNDKNVKKAVKVANLRLYKVITSSLISLIAILSCFFVVLKSGFTPIFAVFSIVSTLYVLYYACNFVGKFKELHYSLGKNFTYPFKKKFLIRIAMFIVIVIILFVINLVMKNKLFAFSNFGNFLSPMIISSLLLVDYLLSLIFYKKI